MALRKENFDDDGEQAENAKKRSRITFDVSPELRRRIKMAALQSDLSIGEYLSGILEQTVPPQEASATQQQGKPIPPDFLEQVYQVREQVIKDAKGEPFEDSTEMIRQMREERTRYLMGEV